MDHSDMMVDKVITDIRDGLQLELHIWIIIWMKFKNKAHGQNGVIRHDYVQNGIWDDTT